MSRVRKQRHLLGIHNTIIFSSNGHTGHGSWSEGSTILWGALERELKPYAAVEHDTHFITETTHTGAQRLLNYFKVVISAECSH